MQKKRRRKNKRPKITSGNKSVDWLFVRIIRALNKEAEDIHKVPILKDPDDRRKRLCGYLDDDNCIWVSTDKSCNADFEEVAKTVLHEAIHIVFPKESEPGVRSLEKRFWKDLSEEQRKMLKSYVPRHHVKSVPLKD